MIFAKKHRLIKLHINYIVNKFVMKHNLETDFLYKLMLFFIAFSALGLIIGKVFFYSLILYIISIY